MLDNPHGKDGKFLTANSNTDMILNFTEMIQFETVDIIKNILDLTDLSYDSLLHEVSKTEGEFEDRKYRYFLKSSYIPREEHEEILADMERELNTGVSMQYKKQLKEMEFLNEDLKKENVRMKSQLESYSIRMNEADHYESQFRELKNRSLEGTRFSISFCRFSDERYLSGLRSLLL